MMALQHMGDRFSGRATWTIENETLRVTVLQSGGHIAEIVLKNRPDISPLWIQPRPTIDSDTYDPAVHGSMYGVDSESRLLSGLTGHNLCFPFWGNPSAAEFAAGMTYHGESGIRRWKRVNETPGALATEVLLPESAMRMTRHFRCSGHALHCLAEASNLSAWDRPFAWCEHVTMGPLFIQTSAVRFDASAAKGFITAREHGPTFIWPSGSSAEAETSDFDLTCFREEPHDDLVNSFLADPARDWAFFTALNRDFGLLFGYVYPRADFPWLNVWESNGPKAVARGMEFSNTPHHGTMKTLIKTPTVFGMPAYEWLDARSAVRKQFIAFLYPVPAGYRGTADITVNDNSLRILERDTGHAFEVPA